MLYKTEEILVTRSGTSQNILINNYYQK